MIDDPFSSVLRRVLAAFNRIGSLVAASTDAYSIDATLNSRFLVSRISTLDADSSRLRVIGGIVSPLICSFISDNFYPRARVSSRSILFSLEYESTNYTHSIPRDAKYQALSIIFPLKRLASSTSTRD